MNDLQQLALDVGIAIAVFASTNVDDILLLSMFFANQTIRVQSVVVGQFLGIGALVAISAAAVLAALAIPPGWVDLLGLFPLLLGIRGLINLFRHDADEDMHEQQEDEHRIESRSHSHLIAVAAVTMANGGDNLGVYIPILAKSPAVIPLYAVVFAFMTALWCVLGYALVRNRVFGVAISRYGHIVLPLVLIVLGIHILRGALVLFS